MREKKSVMLVEHYTIDRKRKRRRRRRQRQHHVQFFARRVSIEIATTTRKYGGKKKTMATFSISSSACS